MFGKSRGHMRREWRWFPAGESPAVELVRSNRQQSGGGERNESAGASSVEVRLCGIMWCIAAANRRMTSAVRIGLYQMRRPDDIASLHKNYSAAGAFCAGLPD